VGVSNLSHPQGDLHHICRGKRKELRRSYHGTSGSYLSISLPTRLFPYLGKEKGRGERIYCEARHRIGKVDSSCSHVKMTAINREGKGKKENRLTFRARKPRDCMCFAKGGAFNNTGTKEKEKETAESTGKWGHHLSAPSPHRFKKKKRRPIASSLGGREKKTAGIVAGDAPRSNVESSTLSGRGGSAQTIDLGSLARAFSDMGNCLLSRGERGGKGKRRPRGGKNVTLRSSLR